MLILIIAWVVVFMILIFKLARDSEGCACPECVKERADDEERRIELAAVQAQVTKDHEQTFRKLAEDEKNEVPRNLP